jgi:6-phosphogluconolactonase
VRTDVVATPELAAKRAAAWLADALRAGIRDRDRACVALSGGSSPIPLFRELVRQELDWSAVHVFQVDERVVRRGDAARNLTALEQVFVHEGPLSMERLHPIWVDRSDLAAAAAAYAEGLVTLAGEPVTLDAVHLGLGNDGHTASLFPGDAALDVVDRAVAVTGEHAGFRRVTLTYPVLNAARRVVWFALGEAKQAMVGRLAAGDASIPAGRVSPDRAVLVADYAAGRELPAARPG